MFDVDIESDFVDVLNGLHATSGKLLYICFKDTHREKEPSNKTPALTINMNMDIWVVGSSN